MSIKTAVTSKFARQILKTKKHSPVLLFGAGTVAMVGSTVLACNATLKLAEILDEAAETTAKIEEVKNVGRDDYTEDDAKKDLKTHKVQSALRVAKLYAPSAGLAVVGIACLTGSHVILSNRNAGLMAAYAALDRGFKEYQNRVRETYGDEAERSVRFNQSVVEDPDNKGKKYKVAHLKGEMSIYARLWDKTTSNSYQESPEYNLAFLMAQQNYMNNQLQARGHVLLNDAYDALGLERTKEGCVVGWVRGGADDYIDFGVLDRTDDGQLIDWLRGDERSIWLDFNVDGVVYDKI